MGSSDIFSVIIVLIGVAISLASVVYFFSSFGFWIGLLLSIVFTPIILSISGSVIAVVIGAIFSASQQAK